MSSISISGLSARVTSIEQVAFNTFIKSDIDSVAWERPTGDTVRTSQRIFVEVDGIVYDIPAQTSLTMPGTLVAGTDYAIWIQPDGSLVATDSFSSTGGSGEASVNSRRIGGFHYAPGGNASFALDVGDGGTIPQINEYSFYDLKWRPAVKDPRGLTLVGKGSFWTGIYPMSADHLTGPVHKFGVDPCRGDGINPPQKIDGSGLYADAQPLNIHECLFYHGFRPPTASEFQLLSYGVKENEAMGGSIEDGPGNTGDVNDRDKHKFTSTWGVFDGTGVIAISGFDNIISSNAELLPHPPNEPRGEPFHILGIAVFGGGWLADGREEFPDNLAGSRYVFSGGATSSTGFGLGGRGVCDHLVIN